MKKQDAGTPIPDADVIKTIGELNATTDEEVAEGRRLLNGIVRRLMIDKGVSLAKARWILIHAMDEENW